MPSTTIETPALLALTRRPVPIETDNQKKLLFASLQLEVVEKCAQGEYAQMVAVQLFHLTQIAHGFVAAPQSEMAEGKHVLTVYLVGFV